MRLNVVPHGLIQSGFVNLDVDFKTGLIDFTDSIVVGWSIFTKTLQDHEVLKVDPSILLSKNIKVGLQLKFGDVDMVVVSVNAFQAEVALKYKDDKNDFNGTATLDIEEEHISLMHLMATGSADGTDVTLELQGV